MRKVINTKFNVDDIVKVNTAYKDQRGGNPATFIPYTAICKIVEISVSFRRSTCWNSYLLIETAESENPGRMLTFNETEIQEFKNN